MKSRKEIDEFMDKAEVILNEIVRTYIAAGRPGDARGEVEAMIATAEEAIMGCQQDAEAYGDALKKFKTILETINTAESASKN